MAEDSGHPQAETDRHIRPDRPEGVRTDEAQQCADAQRTEDQSDEAAEEADRSACDERRSDTDPSLAHRFLRRSRTQEVDAEDEQRDADRKQECVSGNAAGDQAPDGSSHHRRWRHPGEEPPVDAPGPNVLDRGGQRRDSGHPDVRARARRRARSGEDQHGEPDVAEHEPDEAARERGDETPESNGYEEEGVQPVEYPG
jgi:hypothetical protein